MIKFDLTKVKKVATNQVVPNQYNPKEKKGEEYQKVLESIKVNGLMAPIFVRELKKNKYEIIDGEQRWTACEELKYKEVLIYNYGKMSDEEAIQKTIWWQQQVPFDEIKLAEVFTDLVNKVGGDYSKIKLPYSQEEIEGKIEMLKFDWEQFEKEHQDKIDDIEQKEVECPNCGHKFII